MSFLGSQSTRVVGGAPMAGAATLAVPVMAIAAARVAAALPVGDLRVGASNTLQVLTAAAVAVAAIRRSRHAPRPVRTHLRLVGAGAGAWAAGQTYWTFAQTALHVELPFPAPSDAAFLTLFPLMFAALVVAPSSRFHAATRVRATTDALVVGLAVAFVAWTTVLHRVLDSTTDSGVLQATVSLAYPTGDLVVLGALVVMWLGANPAWRAPLLHYLLGFAALMIADGGFAYLTAEEAYATGAWVDAGWVAGMALLWLGVLHVPLSPPTGEQHVQAGERWLTVILAVSFAATVMAVVLQEHRREPLVEHPLLIVVFLGIMTSVMARGIVARREGEAFAAELSTTARALTDVQAEHDFAFAAAGMTTWTWSASDDNWCLGADRWPTTAAVSAMQGSTAHVLTMVDPSDRARLQAAWAAPTPDSPDYDVDVDVTVAGSRAHLRTRGRAHFDPRGSIDRLTGVVFDVTESQTALEALRQRDERLATLNAFSARAARVDSLPILLRDAATTLGLMLRTPCEVWQINPESHSPELRAAWAPPANGNSKGVASSSTARGTELVWTIRCSGAPWGHLRAMSAPETSMTTESDALGHEVAGIVGASLERSSASAALWHGAHHDGLTGLPNRTLLDERLTSLNAEPGPSSAALIYLDLDDFKAVNDVHGHATGDRLLVGVARRLTASVRPTDTVARLGGDEFAILLPGLRSASNLDEVLERVRGALAEPIDLGESVIVPRASIGVATTLDSAAEAVDLLRDADLAMYISKSEGLAKPVHFQQRFHHEAVERGQLADELRNVIDRGELRVHYQPVVDLASGRVCGAEALLRWDRPGVGVLPPATFLDAAVRLGLMEAITAFVMADACHWAASYLRHRPESRFVVEVNVAPSDLVTPTLVPLILEALDSSGLDPTRLCLEVTEAAVIEQSEIVLDTLRALRSIGVGMAIDDFGTGYSSLRQLKALPVDLLKIDKSFVDGLSTELDDSTIVSAIVDMAHTLSLGVIAEGVETETQRDALRGLGCEMAQGYLFGRPAPGDIALERLLAEPDRLAEQAAEAVAAQTVVIADDLEDDRRLIARQLTRSGRYRVVGEAEDGLEAVRVVRDAAPDIVLLDLNMPGLGGLGALARIRTESPRTAAVLLSGHASADDARAAALAGARGCIPKGPSSVVDALDDVLGKTSRDSETTSQ